MSKSSPKRSNVREISRISKAAVGSVFLMVFGMLALLSAHNAGSFFLGLLLAVTGLVIAYSVFVAVKKYRAAAENDEFDDDDAAELGDSAEGQSE